MGPHGCSGTIPFHALQPSHGVFVNVAISYYPFGLHLAPPLPLPVLCRSHYSASTLNMSITEPKLSRLLLRREAALNKIRPHEKRKDRCYDRKRLAEQRPPSLSASHFDFLIFARRTQADKETFLFEHNETEIVT